MPCSDDVIVCRLRQGPISLCHIEFHNRTRHIVNSLSLRCNAHGPLAKLLMHMEHERGKALEVSKPSSDWLNYTGFPGDVCVAFFNLPSGNKDAVMPNSLTKEEVVMFTTVMKSAHQGQVNLFFFQKYVMYF